MAKTMAKDKMAERRSARAGMRKLYRSGQDKIISGVCGGIAEYFDADPVWIRLLTALIILTTGVGLIIYIIAWIIMPVNPRDRQAKDTKAEQVARNITERAGKVKGDRTVGRGRYLAGIILIILGVGFLLRNFIHWWSFNYVWPLILIVIGLFIIAWRRD